MREGVNKNLKQFFVNLIIPAFCGRFFYFKFHAYED
jgi:hypothetical protein